MSQDPTSSHPFVGRKGDRVPNGTALVTVWSIETGEEMQVKPISAREGVAAGFWSREPVAPVAADLSAVPEPSGGEAVADATPKSAKAGKGKGK